MVEGFKLKFTAAELKEHLERRSEYHRKRAEEKAIELPNLKITLENIKKQGMTLTAETVSNMGKSGYRLDTEDPIKRLEEDIQDHKNKSIVFKCFAGHVFDEDYTLKEDDLVRLEILKR